MAAKVVVKAIQNMEGQVTEQVSGVASYLICPTIRLRMASALGLRTSKACSLGRMCLSRVTQIDGL